MIDANDLQQKSDQKENYILWRLKSYKKPAICVKICIGNMYSFFIESKTGPR